MELGAQLYTVREHTKSLDDFALTLQKVAEIGYKTVQVSGTCGYEPEWLREQLKRTGLRCVLTHYDPAAMRENPVEVVKRHKTFGCRYIGIGMIPGGMDKYDSFRDEFLPVAKAFAEQDCLFMYHNHACEFIKENILERMAADFAAEELGFTLDTYWVQAAGGDPSQWLRKLAGRVPCVHLKDMVYDGEPRMAPVYEGNMNFDAILEACRDSGTEYLLVEQDDCYGEDPFACLERSYRNLKDRGLA